MSTLRKPLNEALINWQRSLENRKPINLANKKLDKETRILVSETIKIIKNNII